MKRFAVLAVLTLVVALVASGTASAKQQALTPAEKSLQKQVAGLSKSVTALQKQVKTLTKTVSDTQLTAQAGILLTECSNAVTADALQGTWNVIDQIGTALQQKTYFGAQTPIDDKGLCSSAFGVSRSQVVPPTVAPYAALIGLVTNGGALARAVAL